MSAMDVAIKMENLRRFFEIMKEEGEDKAVEFAEAVLGYKIEDENILDSILGEPIEDEEESADVKKPHLTSVK